MLTRKQVEGRLTDQSIGDMKATAEQLVEWLEVIVDWADLACAGTHAREARDEAQAWLDIDWKKLPGLEEI